MTGAHRASSAGADHLWTMLLTVVMTFAAPPALAQTLASRADWLHAVSLPWVVAGLLSSWSLWSLWRQRQRNQALGRRLARLTRSPHSDPATGVRGWAALQAELDQLEQQLLEERHAQQADQAMAKGLREVGDLTPGAIWSVTLAEDGRATVTYLSRGFEDLYATDRAEVRSNLSRIFAAIHPADVDRTRAAIEQTVVQDTPLHIEHRSQRPDGSYRWTRVLAQTHRDAQGQRSWNGFCLDIHELIQLRQTTESALQRARAAHQAQSHFLANVGHEVRTPLNAILGVADLALEQPTLAPDMQQRFTRIRDAGHSLLHLLNDLLDTARLEAGKVELKPIDFALDQLLERVGRWHADTARHKGLDWQFALDPGVRIAVRGDPVRLQQALGNLLSNAVRFTHRGKVEVYARPLLLPQPDGRSWFEIGVTDTGPGIPRDQQQSIFEPFIQGDSSTERRHGGTGLGLAIVRQLMELMQGEVRLDSSPGQGSCFRLRLPLDRAAHLATVSTSHEPEPMQPLELADEQIAVLLKLIQRGDPRSRGMLQEWFEPVPPALQGLQQALQRFDFQQAERLLQSLEQEPA